MFKLRSIAARLILAISLTVAVACAILGTFSIIQQRALMQLALDQQLKLQYDSVIAALDYEGRAGLAVSAVIASLPPVGDAIAKGDRDALGALLGDAMKALKAQGIPLVTFQTPPAMAFYRVHDPKAFGDDASGRRATVVEANRTGKPIVGVEPGRDTLGIFAMTPIMRDGKSIANTDIGVAFGKEFVERAKQRFGVDLAVNWYDGKGFRKLSSTLGDAMVATPEELKSVFDGASLRRDATVNGHPAALYVGQIKNYAGQPVAVIELVKDTTEYEAAAANSQRRLVFGTIAIVAGAALLAFLLGRGMSRPLTAITAVMNRLSSGDTDVTIPGGERKDELGTIAVAVDVFRRNMLEAGALREAQEAAKREAELEKKALQRQMADRFEADVKGVVGAVAKATAEMQRVAADITASVNGSSERTAAAAAASEEASASVSTVAAATEELASSVAEIGRQVTHSSDVADAAVVKATHHRDGREPHGGQREDRRRAAPDQRHRQPDQSLGAQRHHRGGARRRSRPGFCRGRRRGQGISQPDREGHRRDRRPGHRDPVRHRRLRHRDRRYQRHHPGDQRHRHHHRGRGRRAGFGDPRNCPQRAAGCRRHQRGFAQRRRRQLCRRPVPRACRQCPGRLRRTQPARQRAVRKRRYFPGRLARRRLGVGGT
jgi:methyl-accepting chemotaxis protein